MTTKNGIASVAAIYVECPYCGGGVTGPIYDSFMIIDEECRSGKPNTCRDCERDVVLPQISSLDRRLARRKETRS